MKRSRSMLAAVPLFLLLGCASGAPPPPVAVFGSPEAISALAGTWRGQYWSGATGRSGEVRFELQANTEQAWGSVWMFPAHRGAGEASADAMRRQGPQELQIRFVRALDAGAITGTLDPYRDPDCDCQLSTTFVGKLAGDVIEGSYTTQGPLGHATTDGRWRVTRAPAGAG